MKNKTTTVLLAFLLGSIGVHRFYLGHYGVGGLILLAFICFPPIGLIIALFDFFYFVFVSNNRFNKLYNKDLKTCSDCLEYINKEATTCKFCGGKDFKEL